MKRYEWKCGCGTFETDSRDKPAPCPVCAQECKRVWSITTPYHPTHSDKDPSMAR